MLVLMMIDSCATDTAKSAGSISARIRRTAASCSAARSPPSRGSMPMAASAGSWTASCSTPPATTATARARIGRDSCGASHIAQAMNDTFSSTGVTAGTAKRRKVLSTPADSATSDMNRMYGNIQRVIKVARSNAVGSRASPAATSQTSTGAAATPMIEVARTTQNSAEATWPTNTPVCGSSRRARTSASMGTNAC